MQEKINKAFILAAGFGTRLRPITDKIPKPLVEFNGRPMIETVIDKITSAGIFDIYINIHYHADKMKEYFTAREGKEKITLIEEPEILGTGGAIKNAEPFLNDVQNFIIYNSDVYTDAYLHDLIEHHIDKKPLSTLCVQNRETARSLISNSNNELIGKVNKNENQIYKVTPEESEIKYQAFCGIHAVNREIFSLFPEDESVFDIISIYMNAVKKGYTINCFDISQYNWKDLGIPQNL